MKLCYQVATPDVRHGVGTTSYHADLDTSLHAVASCGYDGVEVMVRDPREVDFAQVEKLAAKHQLSVPMVCTGEIYGQDRLTFSDSDQEVRSEAIVRVKSAIDAAARLGAQANLGRVRGGYTQQDDPAKTYDRIVSAVQEVVDHAASKGVILALEPVNSIALNFINTTAEGLEFVRKINSPYFRIMLDSNHMFIDDPDIDEGIRLAGGNISFVHLADSNRRYPGNCKLDFAAFIDGLRAVGYNGYASVEVFQIPDQDTALRRSYEHLRLLIS